ncbi:MAG: cell division ATP-binding protein FtsE [Clostridia bacterium]|nr:cell division ATP-binding protein FtsE [Clostridia bacterium]MDH7572723.1 cell division ATP-binding protein FtsE [Clostridia bacterium]
MIQLYNVSKIYPGGIQALLDVTVHIDKGEFVFLMGPSGAGKSTLLRLLLREETPTRGQVLVGGRSLARLKPREVPLLRRSIGMVFQDFRLLEERTVYENVAFALEVLEYPREEVRRRVPALLEMVGLAERGRAFPRQLSGGEQQRVAIARAIANNPPIVLADEPTGNLDAKTAWEVMGLLDKINKRGATVVVATHNREIAGAMQRRVITLERGRVVRDEPRGAVRLEA